MSIAVRISIKMVEEWLERPKDAIQLANSDVQSATRSFSKVYEAVTDPMNETIEPCSLRDTDLHGNTPHPQLRGHHVYKASFLGYAEGTPRGMAPRARIATYKMMATLHQDDIGGLQGLKHGNPA